MITSFAFTFIVVSAGISFSSAVICLAISACCVFRLSSCFPLSSELVALHAASMLPDTNTTANRRIIFDFMRLLFSVIESYFIINSEVLKVFRMPYPDPLLLPWHQIMLYKNSSVPDAMHLLRPLLRGWIQLLAQI